MPISLPPEVLSALQQKVNQQILPQQLQSQPPSEATAQMNRMGIGIPQQLPPEVMQKLALLKALGLTPNAPKPLSQSFKGSILNP